jgi:hypothetical protein
VFGFDHIQIVISIVFVCVEKDHLPLLLCLPKTQMFIQVDGGDNVAPVQVIYCLMLRLYWKVIFFFFYYMLVAGLSEHLIVL